MALCLPPLHASAFIMVDDATLGSDSTHDYILHLTQSIPLGQGLFAIAIDNIGNNDFKFNYWSIAEYYSLHSVTYGAAFTPNYVINDPSPVVWTVGAIIGETLNIPMDESVFLGYWDDRAAFDGIPTDNDNYGWVELQNTLSGLTLVGGATAIGGGIYAGTYTQIPEPSTIALICAGATAVLLRNRRKQK